MVPTDLYMQIGGEWLRGDAFPAANGAESHGTGSATFFFHVGGDVGTTSSWRAGVEYLRPMRTIGSRIGSAREFNGTSDVTIADFVWKWAKNGNSRDRYYIVQAEYLRRKEDGDLATTPTALPTVNGIYSGTQSGYYVQGVYQFYPRWRAGLRYDRLDASNAVSTPVPPPLDRSHSPSRVT